MKKLKELSNNEKILIVMLLLSIVLVATSWDRISEKVGKVFRLYSIGDIESTE
jgi:cell division protein FtsL